MNREKTIFKEGLLSIVINIILFILKYIAGIMSGSIAIIADGWHSLSDSLTSIILIASGKLSCKPADKKHPFGHGRIELVASILIAGMLAFTGVEIAIKAIKTIKIADKPKYTMFAIIITIASIVMKEGLAQLAFYYSKETDSKAIKADAWHHRTDALSSVLVIIGVALGGKINIADNIMGICIAIIIIIAAVQIFIEVIDKIIGEAPDKELIDELVRVCDTYTKRPVNAHHFHIHSYGEHKELTFHINLPGEMTLKKAHNIIMDLENHIMNNFNMEVTIHGDVLRCNEKD